MKKLLILCFLALVSNLIFGQNTKEVENGIFVTFPTSPAYTLTSKTPAYTSKTENCLFIVLIQPNIIPNYDKYLESKKNWTPNELKTVEDSFLDGAVKGKLDYTGNKGQVLEIRKGPFNAREVSYSAINPATGERGKRFSTIILVRDKLVSFEVFFLLDNSSAEREKNLFLESISVKSQNEIKTIKGSNLSNPKNVSSNSEEVISKEKQLAIKESEKLRLLARQDVLAKNLNTSMFGTYSTTFQGKRINYDVFAGGKYAEVAKAEKWSEWTLPYNMDAKLEAYNKSQRDKKYMTYGKGLILSFILIFLIVMVKRYKKRSNSNRYISLKKKLKS